MDTNRNFKELWNKQVIRPASMDDLFVLLKRHKKEGLRKLLLANVLLISTTAFIVYLYYSNLSQQALTKAGMAIIILAMLIYLFFYNRLLPFYKTANPAQSNAGFLNQLLQLKKKQHQLHNSLLNMYFILLSVGLACYFYEYTSQMSPFWAAFTYLATLGWVLFNWFYTRPKTIKKQRDKLDEIIDKFEVLNQQLNEK